jgi:hypothetical protein
VAAKLHQGHTSGSRDIQNGLILSGQPSFMWTGKELTDGSKNRNAVYFACTAWHPSRLYSFGVILFLHTGVPQTFQQFEGSTPVGSHKASSMPMTQILEWFVKVIVIWCRLLSACELIRFSVYRNDTAVINAENIRCCLQNLVARATRVPVFVHPAYNNV